MAVPLGPRNPNTSSSGKADPSKKYSDYSASEQAAIKNAVEGGYTKKQGSYFGDLSFLNGLPDEVNPTSIYNGVIYGEAEQTKARMNLLAQQASNPGRAQTTQTKRRSYLNTSNSSQFLTNMNGPQMSLLNLGQ